jgi:hypothetical protein
LQVRERANWIADHDPAMGDNFPELGSRFRTSGCCQIGYATNVGGIEITRSQEPFRAALARSPALIRKCCLKQFDGFCRLAAMGAAT